jgi:PAS domain S-box-containing protein
MTDMTEEINEQEQEHRRLRTSEIRYRRLFEAARDGILIIDAVTRKITDVNPFLMELLHYSRYEILGKELWEIGLLKDAQDSHDAFRELQENGYIRYEDLPLQTKDGTRREVEFVSNVYVEDGQQVIQCNIRDVTDRKKADHELGELMVREKAARADAEAANRSKDEFLAMVSHELRTPLTAILGMTMLLHTGKFEDTASAVEIIERNAKAQAHLIEDILDISRITAGKLHLDVKPLDLSLIINAAIGSVRHMADSKNIKIQTHFEPDAGLVSGDPTRLQQVVWNLLINAIKFSPRGGSVEVLLEGAGDGIGSQAQIVVTDTGSGISAEFLPFVFDRFSQADSTSTRKFGGLGLGLAISRHIVEMHGGTIQVDGGGQGTGAAFTVRLPLAAACDPEAIPDECRTPSIPLEPVMRFPCPAELKGLQVLAIDDEPDTLEMIRAVLAHCGAEVRICISVACALEALKDWWPDVLVSDMAMPDEDGYALIGRVRALERERGKRTPAMALTASVRASDRARVLAAGYDVFVPKPVEPAELVANLVSLVRGNSMSLGGNWVQPGGMPGQSM